MIRTPVLLAVDDEPGLLAMLERFAAPLGFFVITDDGAGNAIARIRAMTPDVALVDIRMPEIGGLDVLRALRTSQPQCRVILMTGQAEVDSAIEAVKLGAMAYLSKPLDLARLARLLAQAADDLQARAAVS